MNKNVPRFYKSTLLDVASKFYHADELYDAKDELCKIVSTLQRITNSVIGVSRRPVPDYGTTFYLNYGGRNLPSTPLESL